MSTRSKTVDSSFKYCKVLAETHYENFPVGSILVPLSKREHIYSIYAFARCADDIADTEVLSSSEKIKRLDELEKMIIEKCVHKNDEYGFCKFLPALLHTIDEIGIPLKELTDLLSAFKQDAIKQRYERFDDLIDYSSRSANPIGHLVLIIFGYDQKSSPEIFSYADQICTALQLTNFWQDVSVDLKMDRIYLPREEMTESGYSYEMLFAGSENDEFRTMLRSLCLKTLQIFESGKPLLDMVGGRLRTNLKATLLGGIIILKKIEEVNYNVLSDRVVLGKQDKVKIFFNALFKKI